MIAHRNLGQGKQRIQRLQPLGRVLDTHDLPGNLLPDLRKQLQFQPHGLLLRTNDFLLDFPQFRGDISFTVGQRLAALIAHGHHIVVGLGDLNIVPEDPVVLNA